MCNINEYNTDKLQYYRSQQLPCWQELWKYYPSAETVIQVRYSDSEQCLPLCSARVDLSMVLHASTNTHTAWALCPTAYDLDCVPLGHIRLQADSQSSGVTWAGLLQWNWLTFKTSSALSFYLAALGVSTVRNSARSHLFDTLGRVAFVAYYMFYYIHENDDAKLGCKY